MHTSVIRTIGAIFLYFLSVLSASALPQWQPLAENIQKSPRDPREYQAIQLANGMRVLLVSCLSAPQSLMALAVPVGFLDDPVNQRGLSHYLEHVVLMGSRKFSESDGLDEFLSKQGGRYNASTDFSRTAFYLEVKNDAFAQAVERLADAIAEPLLDSAAAVRERDAVHAEMTRARASDTMRMWQVTAATINPLHPGARFAMGSRETLSDKPGSQLHDELRKFHQRYYSGRLMVAVLYGKQPVSELAELAASTLGKIPGSDAHVPAITVPVVTERQKGIIIHYVPAKPSKQLKIEFRITNNDDQFRSKTDEYISYLMTHRSQNTLSDWLQNQGLTEAIDTWVDPVAKRNGGVLTITVSLTDQGLAERDKVVAAIFNYLDLLRSVNLKKDYFNEMARMLELEFRYPAIARDMDYIEWLADMMLRYPVAHVLDAPYLADNYDNEAIAARLAEMRPENARIWFISPQEPHNKITDFVEAPYQVGKISQRHLKKWQQMGRDIRLALPTLNPYIPDDFSLIARNADDPGVANTDRPQQILYKPGLRVFYMPGRYFADEPKVSILINLRNRQALDSARHQVLFALTDYLAEVALGRLNDQASMGGIDFSMSSSHGLSLYASGFSQYLPQLLTEWVSGYASFIPTEAQLVQAKSWYREQLEAAEKNNAYSLALQPLYRLSDVPYTDAGERRRLLNSITVQDITAYRNNLLKKSAAEFLVTGNMTAQQTTALAESVKNQLGCEETDWWSSDEVVINQPQLVSLQRTSSTTDAALAAVYVPQGYSEIEGMAYSNMLETILQPWFFNQLRTQEQLGYELAVFSMSVGRQWGLAFALQSDKKNPAYLYQRYRVFYPEIEKRLRTMKDEDFLQYKASLIEQLLQPPHTPHEEFERFSYDLDKDNPAFDSYDKVLVQVKQLTLKEITDYFHQAVIKPQGLALLSAVKGRNQSGDAFVVPAGWKTYPNVSTLQKRFVQKATP